MAKMESKSISVHPDNEQATIRQHELFGWSLQSSQEVYSKDSHLEDRGGDLWNVTTTTNYVKLLFQRDKDMPQYDEVVKLEQEYQSNLEASHFPYFFPSKTPGKFLLIVMGLLVIIGVGTLINGLTNIGSGKYSGGEIFVGILMGILFLAVAVGIFAARYYLYYVPKEKAACAKSQECQAAADKCKEIEKKIRAMNLNA